MVKIGVVEVGDSAVCVDEGGRHVQAPDQRRSRMKVEEVEEVKVEEVEEVAGKLEWQMAVVGNVVLLTTKSGKTSKYYL